MPSKKKKYNARFPAGRIKKIMQSDEEIGKVAQAVPVIIYIPRTLELFVESLLNKTLKITNSRNAKTLSTSHMKQCIMAEQRFDFLRELVKNIPDISVAEDEAAQSSPEEQYPDSDTPYDLSMPSTSSQASTRYRNGGGSAYDSQRLSSGLNNGASSAAATPVNYHKRLANNIGNSTSVIMHTASIMNATTNNNECLPAKLSRSDSTPVQSLSITPKPIWRPIETSPNTPRRRLKQQSQSLPYQNNNINNNNNNTNNNNNNNNNNNINAIIHAPPKKHKLDSPSIPTHQPSAIPAPIFNFDYSSKPIVKIDYSNLPMTTKTCTSTAAATATAPMSAPILGQQNKKNALGDTGFDFNIVAPVISIDLSNFMTATTTPPPPTSATASASSASAATITAGADIVGDVTQKPMISSPAVAKISIGALSLPPAASSASALAVSATTTTAKTVTSTKSNALFELDEDYDNI